MIDRQTIVTVAVKGRYTGKPRPWVVIQSDAFAGTDSITLCLITRMLVTDAPLLRIDVAPSPQNGLRAPSQIQIEKIAMVLRSDVDQNVGRLEDSYMAQVDQAVRFFLGL